MARTQGSHSDITGPRLRAVALALFARHGFAAVSMRRIAGEVGVQAGALYNYTPDKNQIQLQDRELFRSIKLLLITFRTLNTLPVYLGYVNSEISIPGS
jgi:AcrR family transcriptional regulator